MKTSMLPLTIMSVMALQACSDNPLLGKWKLKSGQDDLICTLACKEVIYGSDEMICDGSVLEVSYDIRDKMVVVRQEDTELVNQLMGDQAIEIIDKRTISAAGGKCRWGKTI